MHGFSGAKGGGSGSSFKQRPDTLRSTDTFEGLLGLCAGPIKGLTRGLKSLKIDGTPLEDESGKLNFENFVAVLADGDPTAFPQQVDLRLGAGGSPVGVNLALSNTNASGPGPWITKSVANLNADFLDFRFLVNQLYRQDKTGIYEHSANIEIQMKPTGATNWISPMVGTPSQSYNQSGAASSLPGQRYYIPRSYYDSSGNYRPEANSGYFRVFGKTTSVAVHELRISVPNDGAYADKGWDIRCRLIEKESVDADPNFEKRTITWESVSAGYNTKLGVTEPWRGLAWLQLYGKASDQLTGVPEVEGEYDTLIVPVPPSTVFNPDTRAYTGAIWDGSWARSFTTDPAWNINGLLQDGLHGMASVSPGAHLNKWDALEASKWFSELVPDGAGGTEPRYSLNIAINEPQKASEFVPYLAGAVGALAWEENAGEWRIKADKPEAPSDLFTLEAVEGEFRYSHTNVDTRFNDITFVFLNKEFGYREDRVRVVDSEHIARFGRKPSTIVGIGCTSRQEALRRAIMRLRVATRETRLVNFVTNRRGRLVRPLSVILVADGDLGTLIGSDENTRSTGRIVGIAPDRMSITVRDPLRLELGIDYAVSFTIPNPDYAPDADADRDGVETTLPTIAESITLTNAAAQRGNVTTLYLAQALPESVAPNANIALAAPALPALPKQYRVTHVEPDGERVAISAVEIDTGKWAASDAGEAEEGYVPPIDPVVPPVLDAAVSTGSFESDYGINLTLNVNWERPAGSMIAGYRTEYRINGAEWVPISSRTSLTSIEIVNPQFGTWDFRITTLDRMGRTSEPVVVSIVVDETLQPGYYSDGTPIDNLKPAEAGATDGGTIGGNIKDGAGNVVPPEDLYTSLGISADTFKVDGVASADVINSIATAQAGVDGLVETYGDTASAAASAAAAEQFKNTAEQAAANSVAAKTASEGAAVQSEQSRVSAAVSAASRGLTPNGDFSEGGAGWTAGNAQPADYATPAAFKELSDWNGASNVLVNDYGVRRDIREMPREIIAGRTYRAHWRYRQNAAYAATVYIRHFAADGAYNNFVVVHPGTPTLNAWVEGYSDFTGADLPGSVLFAVNIVTNSSASSGAIVGVDTLFVDDITESKSAEDAAAASVTATATAVAARDDAEIFAGAAHDSEVAAGTSAGNAAASEGAAATSEANAEGYMNTASAQASLSASNAAKALKTTRSMAVDSTHFSLTSGSTIGQEFYSVPVDDGSGTLCFPLGSQAYLSTLGLLPLAADRKYRFYIDCKTDGADIAGAVYPRLYRETGGAVSTPGLGSFTATSSRQVLTTDITYSAAQIGDTIQLRPAVKNNTAGGIIYVYGFWCDDITEQLAAEDAMLASIDSAAVATTKATDAGNFANAAQAERIAAETARGGSENAAGVATAAAASADDDAALAQQQAGLAANHKAASEAAATAAAGSAASADADAASVATNLGIVATYKNEAAASAAARGMTANGDFVEGQVGWNGGNAHTIGTEPAPTFTPTASWNGAANVLVNSSNARKDIRGRPHQVVPGRRYKLYWRFRSTGASLFNAAVRLFNAAGAYTGIFYPGTATVAPNTWVEGSGEFGDTELGSAAQFAINLMSNANGIAATDGIDYFYLEDITESKASAASADISEAQAVIATSEAAAAQASSEMSAQLASQGYLGNANFAIWPGGSGSNPSGYTYWAGSSYTVQRTSGGRYGSPYFMRLPGGSGGANYGMYAEISTGQYRLPFASNQWVVIEVDARLAVGTYKGSGILFRVGGSSNQDAILDLYTDPDTTGATGDGASSAAIRSWRKLVKMSGSYSSLNTFIRQYIMNWWSNFPSSSGTDGDRTIDWYYVNVRPANDAEIKAQQVDGLSATIATQASVLASHDTQLADLTTTVSTQGATITTQQTSIDGLKLRYSVRLNANGYVSGFEQNNDGTQSDFIVQADKFMVAMPGVTPRVIFGVNAAGVLINGDLLMNTGRIISDTGTHMTVQGKGFGTSNQFVKWYGPKMALNLCSEANAISYEKTNGVASFAGELNVGGSSGQRLNIKKEGIYLYDSSGNPIVELGEFL